MAEPIKIIVSGDPRTGTHILAVWIAEALRSYGINSDVCSATEMCLAAALPGESLPQTISRIESEPNLFRTVAEYADSQLLGALISPDHAVLESRIGQKLVSAYQKAGGRNTPYVVSVLAPRNSGVTGDWRGLTGAYATAVPPYAPLGVLGGAITGHEATNPFMQRYGDITDAPVSHTITAASTIPDKNELQMLFDEIVNNPGFIAYLRARGVDVNERAHEGWGRPHSSFR